MSRALEDAQLEPGDIGYLNLHGTATRQNDLMESRAVARVLGTEVPCSSTKGYTGHTLGAAGAIEAMFCWLSLTHPKPALPPHLWDNCRDLELEPINLVLEADQGTTDREPLKRAMSNSFAFGGNNISLIMERTGQ
jgi:3-oxoacyl-[acyl-carrier-protein] synthase-1